MKPFVLQLCEAANGEKISHFSTVKSGLDEIKIFFTDSKVIAARFKARQLVDFESILRAPRESLNGFEYMASQAITQSGGSMLR